MIDEIKANIAKYFDNLIKTNETNWMATFPLFGLRYFGYTRKNFNLRRQKLYVCRKQEIKEC